MTVQHSHQGPHDDEAFVCKGSPPAPSEAFGGARKWSGTLPDKYVALLVEQVSTARLTASVGALAAIPTRHTDSTHITTARTWLEGQFAAMGYAGVTSPAWSSGGHSGQNVVCTKPGAGPATDVIIVCAHYDSRMQTLSNATSPAPGADDNASGVAALLEIARLVQGLPLSPTVRFVAFSGEEQGLLGSTAYAASVQAAGTAVRLVINLDMVGFPPPDGSITVERDVGNVQAGNDAASAAYANVMAQAATDYTDLPVLLGPIYASDYMPFEARGYVTIGAYEGGNNPNYHNTSDAPATVNAAYLTKVTQMTLATLLHESLAVVAESASTVDLYVRDSPADTGTQPSPVPHWTSPDIWVRNAAPADGDNPELGHQPPINGVPNYLYARVHNRGTTTLPAGAATVRTYRCDPGTGMIWPNDFQLIGQLTVTDPVPAGGSARVGPFSWTPQILDHECLLAIASTAADHSVVDVYPGPVRHDLLVRFDNNVGQRNVAPQMAVPKGKIRFTLTLRGGLARSSNDWLLDASALPVGTVVTAVLPPKVVAGSAVRGFEGAQVSRSAARLVLAGGEVGVLAGFGLRVGQRVDVRLTVDLPSDLVHLARYPLVTTQVQDGSVAGQLTIEVVAVTAYRDFVFGNPRSLELHTSDCPLWPRIAPTHKVPFALLEDGVRRGYNGCRFCLPDADTDP